MEGWEKLNAEAAGTAEVINGWSIALKSIRSDGNNAEILLGVTAPEGTDLTQYHGYPISLRAGNRWGFFELVSDGDGNVGGGYGSKEDGDGKTNTQDVVLSYSAGDDHLKSGEKPFSTGKVWNIWWQDIYARYLNEQTNEPEEHLLAKGTWSIDVVFEDVVTEELELIDAPIPAQAAYGWDLQGNDLYQDTMITSLILRPMSASIFCDLEHVAPDFLTVGDRCAYVVMKDGSNAVFYGDNASSGIQNLQTDTPIDLEQVSYLLLPDGTKLMAPTVS